MGTKAIRGRKKGSQEVAYFLSHGDTVITGSGTSKKTLTTKLGEVDSAIGGINEKIPSAASSSNQLADKSYVSTQVNNKTVDTAHIDNGAVTTAKIADANVTKVKLAQDVLNFLEEYLADFKGTVETTAALKALTGNKNDWAVYKHTDSNNNVIYSRYRYDESYNDATTGKWKFEIDINSSAFTAAQWAAINSGITSAGVSFGFLDASGTGNYANISKNNGVSLGMATGQSSEGEQRGWFASLSPDEGLSLTYRIDSRTAGGATLDADTLSVLVTTVAPNFGNKADKVSGATNGNFAALDANGNLVDANCKPSDYQSKLSTAQMNAVNSGITSVDVTTFRGKAGVFAYSITSGGTIDGIPSGETFISSDGEVAQMRYIREDDGIYIVFLDSLLRATLYSSNSPTSEYFFFEDCKNIYSYPDDSTAVRNLYPEFFDAVSVESDLGGYEFDEVDVDTLLS